MEQNQLPQAKGKGKGFDAKGEGKTAKGKGKGAKDWKGKGKEKGAKGSAGKGGCGVDGSRGDFAQLRSCRGASHCGTAL